MKDINKMKEMHWSKRGMYKGYRGARGPLGFVFFTAWIGALVYFEQHADSFWTVILAFLKACVWPAFLIHRALELLHV